MRLDKQIVVSYDKNGECTVPELTFSAFKIKLQSNYVEFWLDEHSVIVYSGVLNWENNWLCVKRVVEYDALFCFFVVESQFKAILYYDSYIEQIEHFIETHNLGDVGDWLLTTDDNNQLSFNNWKTNASVVAPEDFILPALIFPLELIKDFVKWVGDTGASIVDSEAWWEWFKTMQKQKPTAFLYHECFDTYRSKEFEVEVRSYSALKETRNLESDEK